MLPLHLLDGLVLVRLHPGQHPGPHDAQVLDAALEQRRCHHGHPGSRHHGLERILALVHAARHGQTRPDVTVQDGDPVEAHEQLVGARQGEPGHNLEALEIEVRQVEAVEEHQRVGAGTIQPLGQMGQRAEGVPDLDGDGNLHARLHVADQLHVHVLDVGRRHRGVGGDIVDVELQRIGAGLLDLPGVVDPAPGGHPVEAADDRNAHRGLDPAKMLQIGVGTEVIAPHVGKVRERLRVALGAVREMMVEIVALERDLLFEERREHHGRRSRIFHPTDIAHVLAERTGRGHERAREPESEVLGGEINHACPPAPVPAAGRPARCSYSRQRDCTSLCASSNSLRAVSGSL